MNLLASQYPHATRAETANDYWSRPASQWGAARSEVFGYPYATLDGYSWVYAESSMERRT